jgi:5-methylcytosine-specific restriction protein B
VLNESLRPYELHFGYRVFDEIVTFLIAAEDNGLFEPIGGLEAALDAAVLMKVLPKFHGSRGRLEAPLKQVLAWCVDPEHSDASQVEGVLQKELNQHDDPRRALDAVSNTLVLRFPRTAAKVQRMLWHLYTTGFAAF